VGDRNGPLPQQELTIDGLNPDDSQHVIKEKTNHAGDKMRSIETNKALRTNTSWIRWWWDPHPKKSLQKWQLFEIKKNKGKSKLLTTISKITTDVTFWATELNRIYPTVYGL
jgi:hypothetical protein